MKFQIALLIYFTSSAVSSILCAQNFDKQMDAELKEIELRNNCKGLKCLPVITEPLQKTHDHALISRTYKDIAILLWHGKYEDYTSFSSKDALQYSLMFQNTKEVRDMLDSVNRLVYESANHENWSKLDSPWQGKVITSTAGGKALIVRVPDEADRLCLKTDSGWIGKIFDLEGWSDTDSLGFLSDKRGQFEALLVTYDETSYGSGGGTFRHNAFLLDLHTLQTVYKQHTFYSEEEFCGKYGPDPDCIPHPCTIKRPLYLTKNRLLVIGPEDIIEEAPGIKCTIEGVKLSFNIYGALPPNFQNLKIPFEYSLPSPPPGQYKFTNGYLVPKK